MRDETVTSEGKSGWEVWRCRIGRITLKPGAKLTCDKPCGNFF